MRTLVAAAVACLSTIGLSQAGDAQASIKRIISIPAQDLATALQSFARERQLYLIYAQQDVIAHRTTGAVGELTQDEALHQLLSGTGLTYRYLDDKTVSILPIATAPSSPKSRATEDSSAGEKNWWHLLRLAQAEGSVGDTTGGPSEEEPVLEEVLVTAQKRMERLQDVPISISVVRGEQLDTSTLTNLTETLNRIPGVVATIPSLGSPLITMRGAPPTTGSGGVIGYYVDSVPFGFARQARYPDMNVYDFEQIEVLRGPQGTLYGANSMTGVVRLLTKAPDLKAFDAKARASIGAVEDGGENYRADAAVNIPIVEDRLAMRLVGGYQDISGWIDKPHDEDANSGDIKVLRSKIRAQPTDALTLDGSVWFSRSSFDAQSIGNADRTTIVTTDEPFSHDFDIYSFSAVYDFGGASITSATSYIDFALNNSLSFAPIGQPQTLQTSGFFAQVFSQELTLQSTGRGPWRWSVGAMYRDAEDRETRALNGVANLDFGDRSRSSALFGEATREFLSGRIEATLGLRYFYDEFSTAENINTRGTPLVRMEDSSDALTPRAVLAWHPTDRSTLYASYAQGFRSALAQTPATLGNPLFAGAGLGSVKSDKLSNYEIGAKSTFLEGRLWLEGAVYYMDWRDVKAQLSVPIAGSSGPFVNALVNGPSASGAGIDAAITFRPINRLEIGGSVSWNDLTMDESVVSSGRILYNKGDRLAFSPKTTANGFAEYSFPLGRLTGSLSASVNYISAQYQVVAGPTVFQSDSLTTESARFTVESGDHWSVSLFGDNLSDENGIPSNNANIGPWQPRIPPRTFGIQLELHY
jgi:iron complex outermembrane recepter protein